MLSSQVSHDSTDQFPQAVAAIQALPFRLYQALHLWRHDVVLAEVLYVDVVLGDRDAHDKPSEAVHVCVIELAVFRDVLAGLLVHA